MSKRQQILNTPAEGGWPCPKCMASGMRVMETRFGPRQASRRRRHVCGACKHRMTTYERLRDVVSDEAMVQAIHLVTVRVNDELKKVLGEYVA